METNIENQEKVLNSFFSAGILFGCITYDILGYRITNATIEMCKYAIELNGEDKCPDFVNALANWKDLTDDKSFIAGALRPLADEYLNDDKLVGLLRISSDEYYYSARKQIQEE